jgi:hypothetical protein
MDSIFETEIILVNGDLVQKIWLLIWYLVLTFYVIYKSIDIVNKEQVVSQVLLGAGKLGSVFPPLQGVGERFVLPHQVTVLIHIEWNMIQFLVSQNWINYEFV